MFRWQTLRNRRQLLYSSFSIWISSRILVSNAILVTHSCVEVGDKRCDTWWMWLPSFFFFPLITEKWSLTLPSCFFMWRVRPWIYHVRNIALSFFEVSHNTDRHFWVWQTKTNNVETIVTQRLLIRVPCTTRRWSFGCRWDVITSSVFIANVLREKEKKISWFLSDCHQNLCAVPSLYQINMTFVERIRYMSVWLCRREDDQIPVARNNTDAFWCAKNSTRKR